MQLEIPSGEDQPIEEGTAFWFSSFVMLELKDVISAMLHSAQLLMTFI